MRTLNITNDDLQLNTQGNLGVATDLEGLRQKIVQKLRFFRGDWFLNSQEGIPYYQNILVKPSDAGFVTSILNNAITEEVEVTGLGAVTSSLDPVTREFFYSVQVQTIFGTMGVEL